MQPEERQLALRPVDMSFEQAMLHYMAHMNDRQVRNRAGSRNMRKQLPCNAMPFPDGLVLCTVKCLLVLYRCGEDQQLQYTVGLHGSYAWESECFLLQLQIARYG